MGPSGSAIVDPAAIPVRNAWHLLLYAWDLARWGERWRLAAETAPNLLGLLGRVLVEATQELQRRRLASAHQVTVQEIPGLRGRIDFGASLRRRSFDAGRAVCAFPEMSVDTPKNRIIKGTLERLLTDERVGAGAHSYQVQALRHDIRAVLDKMDDVTAVRPSAAELLTVRLGRNDERYQLPMAVCGLILGSEMPKEDEGDRALAALLRDEIRFSDLFERFVRNFLKHSLPGAVVTSEVLSWHDELGSSFVPSMRTDVTIEWAVPERRLVIDAKYYGKTLAARYGNLPKFHSTHLYQLYAYLRTQEHRGGTYRDAGGMLLYPTTSSTLRETMRVQGHEIRVATLDLSRPWAEIEQELLGLVEPTRLRGGDRMAPQDVTDGAET